MLRAFMVVGMWVGFGSSAVAGTLLGATEDEGSEGRVGDGPLFVGAPEDPPSSYIVAGTEVEGSEYDSVVFLEMGGSSAGESTCTGSLIHPYWVLTAAHCVDNESITHVTANFGNSVGNFFKSVRVDKVEGQPLPWTTHPDWDGFDDGDFEGDVALVHLSEPVLDIFPMALNKQKVTTDWIDLKINFIGFGITEFQGGGSGIKRQVETPITGVPENGYEIILYDGVHSTCQGDSGGPGILRNGAGYTQVTVTSYGVDCGDGITGVMRVDAFLPWIRDIMGVDEPTTQATAPPSFRCSHEQVPGDPGTLAIGVTDLDLKCVIDFYAPENITHTRWAWGDGGTLEKDVGDATILQGDHVYTEMGNYNVKLCVDYVAGEFSLSHCARRNGYVRACGVPDVQFTYNAVDTRTLEFLNFTDSSAYGCIYNVQWDVHEGDSTSGPVVDTLNAWAPTYEFPDGGTYTMVLSVGGLGGTGAAEMTIDVSQASRGAGGCATGGLPSTGVAGLVLVSGLIGWRRRRVDPRG